MSGFSFAPKGYLCYNDTIMKVIRNHTRLTRMTGEDDSFVNASPAERVGLVWELTCELWSLRDEHYAERRLQRDVASLIKKQG